MAIDILNIQPSVISKDLRGKYVLLYGRPKSGKTTAACAFPNSLLIAFERGYNAIGGVRAADITKWSDFKIVLRQLEKPEAQKMYETIIIDTISIAWDYCEQFICAQNSVQKIADIPWGGGYTAAKKEFESALRKITMLGYGIVLIAHSTSRIEKTAEGGDVEIISPEMPKRAAEICNADRQALRRISALRTGKEVRVSGCEALVIIGSAFFMERQEHTRLVGEVAAGVLVDGLLEVRRYGRLDPFCHLVLLGLFEFFDFAGALECLEEFASGIELVEFEEELALGIVAQPFG